MRVDLNPSLLLAVLSLDFPALEFFDVGVFRFVFERFRRHPLRRWRLLANAPLSLPSAPVYSPRSLRVLPRRFLPPAARAGVDLKLVKFLRRRLRRRLLDATLLLPKTLSSGKSSILSSRRT